MAYEPIDIKCPDCGCLAKFEEPFEFFSQNERNIDEAKVTHIWGGWIVLERFPSQINWKAPSGSHQFLRGGGDSETGGYPLFTNGLVHCSKCYSNSKHKLNWPNDAFWQWDIRGKLLWAWDERHAQTIRRYLRQYIRGSRRSPSLKYIPSHFLSSKVREQVIKEMDKSLNA